MQQGIILFCLILICGTALACAMFRSMLKSAISLAAISALLAVIFFCFNCTWAAIFELSVCAGLVTVVFVSAISLTTPNRRDPDKAAEHSKRFSALPFILIFSGMAAIAIMLITGFTITPAESIVAGQSFKDILWNTRQADILGQIIIILAGAFAVVILFKESDKA